MKKAVSLALVMGLCAIGLVSKGEAQVIEEGKKVTMDYTLTVDGEVVDSSEGRGPLEYVQGQGMIIPGLEKEMAGMAVGDKKSVEVMPAEGYGEADPQAVVEVPKANLGDEITPEVGMVLQMQSPEGQTFNGIVQEVKDETLMIDFNHPLAGKTLNFDVEVVGVE